MIGHVISFDEVNKADIRNEMLVPPRVEECFQGEKSVSATKFRGADKLESDAVFVQQLEGVHCHDR